MTAEKAKKHVDRVIEMFAFRPEAPDYDFWLCVREALEKQIPKKPIIETEMEEMEGDKYAVWQCPSCKCRHHTECGIKYCSKCGQAIDLSEG